MFERFRDLDRASIFWVLLWCASFSTSMAITKLLSDEISTFMIVLVRLVFGMLVLSPIIFKTGINKLKTKRLPMHFLRVIFMLCAMICTYYAYAHLELAFATSIGFTGPMITTILAMAVLGDRVTVIQWSLIVLGYIGVLVMVRPGYFEYDPAVIVALGANFFASCTMITTKKLNKTDSPLQILSHSYLIALVILSLLAPLYWQTPTLDDIGWLALLGCTGTFSQYCYTRALQKGDPSVVAPFEYSRLVFAVPIGMLIFAEVPTVWTILGSIIIIFSNFFLTYNQSQKYPRRQI